MPNYRNKSKIVKREELIPDGRLEEGMIVTFRYNGGSDKTPVVLVIYHDKQKKMIEGINLKFYKDVVKGDSIIKRAYRSYYLTKMGSLKAVDLKENLLG